jgi:hypothetical protein
MPTSSFLIPFTRARFGRRDRGLLNGRHVAFDDFTPVFKARRFFWAVLVEILGPILACPLVWLVEGSGALRARAMTPGMGALYLMNVFLWFIAAANDGVFAASRYFEPGGHPPRTDLALMILFNCTMFIRMAFIGSKYALFSDEAFKRIRRKDVTLRGVLNSLLSLSWGRLDRTSTFMLLRSAEEALGVDLEKMPVHVCDDAEEDAASDDEWDESQALARWDNKFHAEYPEALCSLPRRAPHPQLSLAFSADLDHATLAKHASVATTVSHALAGRAGGSLRKIGAVLPSLNQLENPNWQAPKPEVPQITAFDVAFQLLMHPVIKDPITLVLEGEGEFKAKGLVQRLFRLPLSVLMMGFGFAKGILFLATAGIIDAPWFSVSYPYPLTAIDKVQGALIVVFSMLYLGTGLNFLWVSAVDRKRRAIMSESMEQLLTTGYAPFPSHKPLRLNVSHASNLKVFWQLRRLLNQFGSNFLTRMLLYHTVYTLLVIALSLYLIVMLLTNRGRELSRQFLVAAIVDLTILGAACLTNIFFASQDAEARIRHYDILLGVKAANLAMAGTAANAGDSARFREAAEMAGTVADLARSENEMTPVSFMGIPATKNSIASLTVTILGGISAASRIIFLAGVVGNG